MTAEDDIEKRHRDRMFDKNCMRNELLRRHLSSTVEKDYDEIGDGKRCWKGVVIYQWVRKDLDATVKIDSQEIYGYVSFVKDDVGNKWLEICLCWIIESELRKCVIV